jgi:hypothetical protein
MLPHPTLHSPRTIAAFGEQWEKISLDFKQGSSKDVGRRLAQSAGAMHLSARRNRTDRTDVHA